MDTVVTEQRRQMMMARRENASGQQQMAVKDTAPVAGARVPVRNEHTGISAHPSTFVHAPPGGKSSLNLFGGDDAPIQPKAPAPVADAAPKDGVFGARVAVQTEHTGISDRPSTFVHAPPGGKSSLNLFG